MHITYKGPVALSVNICVQECQHCKWTNYIVIVFLHKEELKHLASAFMAT